MLPGRRDSRAPELWLEAEPPHRTPSRAGGSLTMVISTSEPAATSWGDLASVAPAATSDSAREAVRFQTVKEYPAFKRFKPMGRPMSPSPINPTFEPGPMVPREPTFAPGPTFTPGPMLVLGRSSGVTKILLRITARKTGHGGENVGLQRVDCNRIAEN